MTEPTEELGYTYTFSVPMDKKLMGYVDKLKKWLEEEGEPATEEEMKEVYKRQMEGFTNPVKVPKK